MQEKLDSNSKNIQMSDIADNSEDSRPLPNISEMTDNPSKILDSSKDDSSMVSYDPP